MKIAVIKCEQQIHLLIGAVYSIYFTKANLQKNRFQEKGDTIHLPFPASLMLIREFLRKMRSLHQEV